MMIVHFNHICYNYHMKRVFLKYMYNNINYLSKDEYINILKIVKKTKQNKVNKIENIDSKQRSLLGEALFIKLLKENGFSYRKIVVYRNKYGKPMIKNNLLYFNISHSFDYSICAISDAKIGIDIEKIRKVDIRVINQFASSNESKYIIERDENIYKRLFEIYTLKESYFKCYGTNLNNIKNVEFIIKNNKVVCSDSKVKLSLIYDIPGYIVSICSLIN